MTASLSIVGSDVRSAKAVANIAMTLVLVSFSMLFATLFLGYAVLRFTAIAWPPMGMKDLPVLSALVSTVFIVASSFTWIIFERGQKTFWAVATFIFGFAFTLSQFLLWSDLSQLGIYSNTGTFASVIYAFTWIHVAHIGLGLLLLLWPIGWSFKQELNDLRAIRTASIGKFWHFLGIVWILMFISLFLF